MKRSLQSVARDMTVVLSHISATICGKMMTGKGNTALGIRLRMEIIYWNKHPILCR